MEFVATHFSFLNYAIKGLQEQQWTLANQLQYYEDAKAKLMDVPGKYGELVRGKFDRVEERNPGIQQLFQVRDLQLAHPDGYTDLINCLKFAVTVSVDCERRYGLNVILFTFDGHHPQKTLSCFSFSIYKNILTDKRQSLTKDNLKKIVTTRMFFSRNSIASCAEDTDDSLRPTTAFH